MNLDAENHEAEHGVFLEERPLIMMQPMTSLN